MKRNYASLLILVSFLLGSCQPAPTATPTSTPRPALTTAATSTPQPVPSATSTSGAPGITPTSNIPFKLTQWSNAGKTIRLILYLDDPSKLNAVRFLRDGLMAELARSGLLPPGYPKFTQVPVSPAQNCDVSGRYAIQLSEGSYDYFVLPLCRETVQDASMTIYILQSGSTSIVDYQTPRLYIGIKGSYNNILGRQEELLLQALANLGLAAYLGTDSP